MKINLGYACINTELRKNEVYCSRTCRISTLQKDPGILKQLVDDNLRDLMTILEWNDKNDIRLFRMSSQLFPFASHEKWGYSIEPWQEQLKKIGEYARDKKIRITFHPGQYCVLSSEKENVVVNSIRELEHHAEILQRMGCDQNSIMVIHGGSKTPGAMDRFKKNFYRLSVSCQKRLVLENCEMCYKVEDLLPVCHSLNIPLVIDYHHFNINNDIELEFLIPFVLKTWKRRGIKPKFHYSESEPGCGDSLTERRKHSKVVQSLPKNHPEGVDLMIEAKDKEVSIFLLRNNLKI